MYIGSTLCGTLPGTVEIGKVYPIICDTIGDFVQLVTGGTKLAFAEVEVYTKSDNLPGNSHKKDGNGWPTWADTTGCTSPSC